MHGISARERVARHSESTEVGLLLTQTGEEEVQFTTPVSSLFVLVLPEVNLTVRHIVRYQVIL